MTESMELSKSEIAEAENVSSLQDLAAMAYEQGARNVEVYEHNDEGTVEIEVTDLSPVECNNLSRECNKHTRAGVKVCISSVDNSGVDYGNVQYQTTYQGVEIKMDNDRLLVDNHDITDQYAGTPHSGSLANSPLLGELKERIDAGELPPEPMLTETEHLPLAVELDEADSFSDIDEDVIQPYIEKYGSFENVLEVFERSTVDTSQNDDCSDNILEWGCGTPNDPQNDYAEKTTVTTDSLEEAKEAYVRGDIDILECEERLEDLIEIEPWL
ncbi:hypothetical protein [Natrinema sp. DC36]|uniref:hypothetical protein n=1 Tax=Natrinema sp. DC36 TaxID=2878680 RepID=UPI001CF05050|nr:hypothetical protein [Natrinema sp. DC36]